MFQMVKDIPTMQETRIRSLSWEDPLKKWMATHSSILPWKIPWSEKPKGLQSLEPQRVEWEANSFTLHTM